MAAVLGIAAARISIATIEEVVGSSAASVRIVVNLAHSNGEASMTAIAALSALAADIARASPTLSIQGAVVTTQVLQQIFPTCA